MKPEKMSYAEAIAEIEEILARFDDGGMDVDMLAVNVKRATELIKMCRERLRKAEGEVAEILKEEE